MRRLIICCDGTWNQADWQGGTATNVIRIVRAIAPVATAPDGTAIPQIVYYHPGVGTGNGVDRLLGGGLGLGLSQNVRDAYAFLANNYVPGDEIFLLGFSRGAYTARTLSGLIHSIGLLSKSEMGGFMNAWAFHRLKPAIRASHAAKFAALFPDRLAAVPVRCVAVWDTVGALGIPKNRITGNLRICKSAYQFHDVTLGTHVAYAFQGLAIDEQRRPFKPSVWIQAPDAPAAQVVKQMWFSGVHSDIGGGYSDHGAADVALLWIASELESNGLLNIDRAALSAEFDTTDSYGRGALHDSMKWSYRMLTGRLHRKVAAGPTEHVHATVAARRPLPASLAAKVSPFNPLETALSGYVPTPLTQRSTYSFGKLSLCDWFVRVVLGY